MRVNFADAKEVHGMSVDGIALVKRGAIRAPFKIVKSEDGEMLDFTKLTSAFFKTAEPRLGVLAAVVRKGDDVDRAKHEEMLKAAGLVITDVTEQENLLIYKQPNVDEHEVGLMKINDEVGLCVSGLKKAFNGYDFRSSSFNEVMAAESFYPCMYMANEMFNTAVRNAMNKADSPAEASSAIQKITSEFGQFMTTLAAAIPAHAFKAEQAFIKADAEKVAKTAAPVIETIVGKPIAEMTAEELAEGVVPFGKSDKDVPLFVTKSKAEKAKGKEKAVKEEIANAPVHGSKTSTTVAEIFGTKSNDIENNPAHGNSDLSGNKVTGGKNTIGDITGTTSNDIERTPAVKTETPAKADEAPVAANTELLTQIGALLKSSTDGLRAEFEAMVGKNKDDIETIRNAIGGISERQQKADKALFNTVTPSSPAEKTGIVKADPNQRDSAPPLLDSAFGGLPEIEYSPSDPRFAEMVARRERAARAAA